MPFLICNRLRSVVNIFGYVEDTFRSAKKIKNKFFLCFALTYPYLCRNKGRMLDISAYIHSEWSWVILFVAATFVGMSKTGIQGLTILTVPLLAMAFGAKPSTGLMLPVLCFADVIGVS